MGQNLKPGYGPLFLVIGSICQGKPFWGYLVFDQPTGFWREKPKVESVLWDAMLTQTRMRCFFGTRKLWWPLPKQSNARLGHWSGLLKRKTCCNHLKHVAFSTPKQGATPQFTRQCSGVSCKDSCWCGRAKWDFARSRDNSDGIDLVHLLASPEVDLSLGKGLSGEHGGGFPRFCEQRSCPKLAVSVALSGNKTSLERTWKPPPAALRASNAQREARNPAF